MKKDYSDWHKVKTQLHNTKVRAYFHQREIWFCSIGSNVGFEQDGQGDTYLRPAVILKKFNNEVCIIIPLTKTKKDGVHYFSFSFNKENTSTAILSQIRLVDAKRLEYKIGKISPSNFVLLKEKLIQLLV